MIRKEVWFRSNKKLRRYNTKVLDTGGFNKKQRITLSTWSELKRAVPCPTLPVREPNNSEKK